MAMKIFGKDYPKGSDLELKTILVLVNSHPAIDFPEPLTPNVIPVGGLQVHSVKPLPEDINDFINSSKKGSVLFSLGTNVKSEKLGAEKQKIILEAFARMPNYHFLWKFEADPKTLPMEIRKNVMIKNWMPQNDILGHNKIKAFITHSGTLSTHEATWHGVPMIGMPFFVDQYRNLHKSVKAGVAKRILFDSLTTDGLIAKVTNVLENPSYRDKMKIRSMRFCDQPKKPIERAVWWIEYILRNPNPEHLLSPVLKLGFFKSNIFDIVFAMGVLTETAFILISYLGFSIVDGL